MPTAIARALILSSKKPMMSVPTIEISDASDVPVLYSPIGHTQIAHDLRLKKRHAVHEGRVARSHDHEAADDNPPAVEETFFLFAAVFGAPSCAPFATCSSAIVLPSDMAPVCTESRRYNA